MIRLATVDDREDLLRICTNARLHLNDIGITQWPDYYPDIAQIMENVAMNEVYVWEELGKAQATITVNHEGDSLYNQIKWNFPAKDPFVIHRLIVDPNQQGKKIGKKLMQFAEDLVAQKGGGIIRLDTFANNPISMSLYKKMGYLRAEGSCYFYGPEKEYVCFDKKIAATE